MNNKKNLILIIVLVMGFLITSYALLVSTNNKIKPVTVYKYARDIDGTVLNPEEKEIKASDIIPVTIPQGAVNEAFALDKDEIVGKVVKDYVHSDTYVYTQQLTDEKEDIFSELFESTDISRLRTVTVAFELTNSLAGSVIPGDRVDLVYCAESEKVVDNESSSSESKGFNYAEPFAYDVWVYQVNTGDGFMYQDISQSTQVEAEGQDILQYVTFITDIQQAIEISNRAEAKGTITMLGRTGESVNCDVSGHVLGDYSKLFSGYANVETGKMNLEETKETN